MMAAYCIFHFPSIIYSLGSIQKVIRPCIMNKCRMLFFPFSILGFLLFFFYKRQNLDASLFCDSVLFLHLSTLQTSVTSRVPSVSHQRLLTLCVGLGAEALRGCTRVHVSPVHLAPLQHLGGSGAGSDTPAVCLQPDADAVVCPRRSQTSCEDSTSTCQKECLLLELCGKITSVTSVFIFAIITQR